MTALECCVNLHSQLASIMEVLANAAVADICQLVDDSFAALRLELSRSRRENLALKSRLRLIEVRGAGQRRHRESAPRLVLTCARRDHTFEDDVSAVTKTNIRPSSRETNNDQELQTVSVTDVAEQQRQASPENVLIKTERREEEENDKAENGTAESHPPPPAVIAVQSRRSNLAHFEMQEAEQQHRERKESESLAQEAPRVLTKGDDDSAGPVIQMYTCTGHEAKGPVMPSSLDPEVPGVKDLGGGAAASTLSVKLEATENTWSEPLGEASVSNSTISYPQQELDSNSLDSSSFCDLFSTPDVARSLTDPYKQSTEVVQALDESLASSCFPFLSSSRSSFGNSNMSDCITGSSSSSSYSNASSRSFPSNMERAFSWQQSRDLELHQRSHASERAYQCHLCKKSFAHPHQLKTHQRVHTGEKPFSCAQCGKRFSQSSHIKRHMSVHTGEKRYSCSLCGKRFSQSCSLKKHQAVHTGERPYSCTTCGKNFSLLGNLVRHQSIHAGKLICTYLKQTEVADHSV